MLQAFRNNTKTILWIVVIAFIGFIILVWGADLRFGSQQPNAIGSVNGQEIPYQSYQRRLTANLQNMRSQSRQPTFEEERRVADQTWQQMVDEILVYQEAEKGKIPVSDAEVVFWVRSNPPDELYQNPAFVDSATGQFNMAAYEQALRATPEQFLWYEQATRIQLPMTKLERTVLSAAKVSDGDVDTFVRERYENMQASYLWVNPATFMAGSTAVSEEEARAYYEAHPDEFKTVERARLVVARLPKKASAEDENTVLEEVRGFASTIAAGDATLGMLAESFSEDAFAAQGGDRGRHMKKSEVEPELAPIVFSLPVGQVSAPTRIGDRLLLVQVTADSILDGEPARRFATIERRIAPGGETLGALRTRARELAALARRQGLAAAMKTADVEADTTALFEPNSFSPLLAGAPEALSRAFESSVGTVGAPIETETDIILYQLIEKQPAGTLPFAEVKARAERGVLSERQRAVARQKAERVYATFKAAGGSLEATAMAETLSVRDSRKFTRKGFITDVGSDPELVGAAFALKVGQTSGLLETAKGFFIVRADSLFPPLAADHERQRQTARQILERERQNTVQQMWLADLRSRAKIEDRRSKFF
jgi:peptidyl-prolyl cis-trans isomerase D